LATTLRDFYLFKIVIEKEIKRQKQAKKFTRHTIATGLVQWV